VRRKCIFVAVALYAATYIVGVPTINMAFKNEPCAHGYGFNFSYQGIQSAASSLISGETEHLYNFHSFAVGPLLSYNSADWGSCRYKQISLWLFGIILPIYGEYTIIDYNA